MLQWLAVLQWLTQLALAYLKQALIENDPKRFILKKLIFQKKKKEVGTPFLVFRVSVQRLTSREREEGGRGGEHSRLGGA